MVLIALYLFRPLWSETNDAEYNLIDLDDLHVLDFGMDLNLLNFVKLNCHDNSVEKIYETFQLILMVNGVFRKVIVYLIIRVIITWNRFII